MGIVVIVDDEEAICGELLDCVEGIGLSGRSFTNPLLGLAFLNETNEDVDVVLVDVMMPEMGGETFIKNAKNVTGTKTRYYLMSGVSKCDMDPISSEAGVLFLHKPLSFAGIKKILK